MHSSSIALVFHSHEDLDCVLKRMSLLHEPDQLFVEHKKLCDGSVTKEPVIKEIGVLKTKSPGPDDVITQELQGMEDHLSESSARI